MPAVPRRDKGVYVELPPDVIAGLAKRCQVSGWTRKAEITLAIRHWLAQAVVPNPVTKPGRRK